MDKECKQKIVAILDLLPHILLIIMMLTAYFHEWLMTFLLAAAVFTLIILKYQEYPSGTKYFLNIWIPATLGTIFAFALRDYSGVFCFMVIFILTTVMIKKSITSEPPDYLENSKRRRSKQPPAVADPSSSEQNESS